MNRVVETVNNFRRVKLAMRQMKGADVGYLKETTGPKQPYGSDLNLATNAMFQEYGTKRIPPRPFMREGANRFEKNQLTIARALRMVVEGTITPRSGSQRLGVIMQQNIQNSIRSGSWAPLKSSTILAKGSSKPLIDTGALIQGVDAKAK